MSNVPEIVALSCNHCGAALDVGPQTRFVTCAHCGSRLEIHRSGSAMFTEVLQQLDERTERIAEDVETIKLQNELERLDREWEQRRQNYLTRNKDGSATEPSKAGNVIGVIMCVFAMGFAIFWMGMTVKIGAPFPMTLFGIVFLIVPPIAIFSGMKKSGEYREELQRHTAARERLLREMESRGK